MDDGKSLSAYIRNKKKQAGAADLRQDMDYAGQEGSDPVVAYDAKLANEVNNTLGEPDHEPATDAEMGENESSQDVRDLKKSMARIARYLDSL
jgi:hypothetical protein